MVHLKEEMAQKYRELKKREIQMDEFLNNFDENKKSEIDQLYSTRKSIVNFLELISKVTTRFDFRTCFRPIYRRLDSNLGGWENEQREWWWPEERQG